MIAPQDIPEPWRPYVRDWAGVRALLHTALSIDPTQLRGHVTRFGLHSPATVAMVVRLVVGPNGSWRPSGPAKLGQRICANPECRRRFDPARAAKGAGPQRLVRHCSRACTMRAAYVRYRDAHLRPAPPCAGGCGNPAAPGPAGGHRWNTYCADCAAARRVLMQRRNNAAYRARKRLERLSYSATPNGG